MRDYGSLRALAPHFQLLNSGGAKRIGGGHNDAHSIVFRTLRHFGRSRRLSCPINANHEKYGQFSLFWIEMFLDQHASKRFCKSL